STRPALVAPDRYLTAVHAFPTRRSSELIHRDRFRGHGSGLGLHLHRGAVLLQVQIVQHPAPLPVLLLGGPGEPERYREWRRMLRSEEHTSELQSHLNLVCRLLLDKKKSK